MKRIVLRRLLTLVPLVWLVLTATFLVVHAAPGSYADTIDHPRLSPEGRELIRARYGLDRPVGEQYLRWLDAAIRGDLGSSFLFKEPVARVIGRSLAPTVLLAGSALALDLILGFALALAAVRRPYGLVDRLTTVLALGLYGLPSFWLAGLAILLFSLVLGILPPSHLHSVNAAELAAGARLLDLLAHLVLPATVLGVVGAGATSRYLRATLLEVRGSRYLLAARARGLSEKRLLWVHSLRPALLPVVTLLGLSLPVLASGSVVVETVFSWPGMGRTLWWAAQARDVPLVLGITLVGVAAVVLGNLAADVLYAVVDPRAREER
jgi:peptide/nickel transport system permease protein